MTAEPRRAATVFVFITVTLDMLAFGAIAPVLVPRIVAFLNGDVLSATRVVGAFGTVFALMQFVWAPVLGVLSDRFGRKPVIVLSCLGMGVDYLFMALAPTLAWLLLGRVVSGITSANAATAGAYISDVTPPEKRAAGFGLLGAAFGLGFILGPALGGLLGQFGPRLPFYAAAALSLANALYGALVLPESLPLERRSNFRWSRANPVGSLRLLRRHRDLASLATVLFMTALATCVMMSTWVLYVTYRYHWQPGATGVSLALIGLGSGLTQALVVQPFIKRFGERLSLLAGIAFAVIGMIVCGLASTEYIFVLGFPFLSLWGIASAAAQAMLTMRVAPEEQGEVQGALGSLRGLAMMIGPALFTGAFAAGIALTHPIPGAAWFAGAGLLALSFLPALRATPLVRRDAIPA